MAALSLEGIRHRFSPERLVLDGITLDLPPGEILCLLGPSGCGKTTLLRLIAGLEPLQQGRIRLGGRVLAETGRPPVPAESRSVGFVFQDYALFPHLTVRENLLFGLKRRRDPAAQARADQLLQRLGLGPMAGVAPSTLSGGQMQRLAVARALAPEPQAMLMDEPFSSLDPGLREDVRNAVLAVLRSGGVTSVIVTHDAGEAMAIGDRIAVMSRAGQVAQIGRPGELYAAPRTRQVAELFGPVNWLSGRVSGGAVATPLGILPVPGMAEGAAVDLLLRPEALRLGPPEPGLPLGRVLACWHLGRVSHLHVALPGMEGHLEVDAWGVSALTPGQEVTVGVEAGAAPVALPQG